MAKKLLSVWLSLTILIFSSISIYADEVIQGDFFLKNIVINGENIVNYELSNPFLMHNDRLYVPMDSEIGKIMGFEAEMDNESRTLKILKTNPVQKNLTERGVKNNLEKVPAAVRTDISVVVYQDAQNGDASLTNEQANVTGENTNAVILNAVFEVSSAMNFDAADEAAEVYSGELSETGDGTVGSGSSEAVVTSGPNAREISDEVPAAEGADKTADGETSEAEDSKIGIPKLTASQIDLMEQPVLVKDTIVYVPLNAIVSYEPFGWSSYYESYSGVYISTDDEIDAASYFKAADSNSIKGRAAYIVHINPNVPMNEAANMVRYFDAYGKIYSVDPKLLMAVAQCESTFYTGILNSHNCAGLMQIKLSTGESYGFSNAQLLQMKPNIQMGAIYLGQALTTFGQDRVKALSSYNWGIGSVKKGSYNTKYATKVLSKYDRINSFLTSEGYL